MSFNIGTRVTSNFTGFGTVTSGIVIDTEEKDGPKCQKVLFDLESLGERLWPICKLERAGEDGE